MAGMLIDAGVEDGFGGVGAVVPVLFMLRGCCLLEDGNLLNVLEGGYGSWGEFCVWV